MSDPLEKEFEYYLKHQDELVAKYNGKFIVIKNQEIIGDFDKIAQAVEETSKTHEIGTFLVQKCTAGDQDYTQIFHSRIG